MQVSEPHALHSEQNTPVDTIIHGDINTRVRLRRRANLNPRDMQALVCIKY